MIEPTRPEATTSFTKAARNVARTPLLRGRGRALAVVAVAGVSVLVAARTHALGALEGAIRPAEAAPSHAAGSPEARGIVAEGRVVTYPGARVTLSAEIPGRLVQLAEEKARVKKGDVVATLADDEQRAALAEAAARAEEARADRTFLGDEADRTHALWSSGALGYAGYDRAGHDHSAAKARYGVALAEASRLKAVVDKASVHAPIDGTVLERRAEPGEVVPAGAPVLEIADLSRLRIEVEVDEFDAARVHVGQRVRVSAEGFAGARWKGKIEEIPDQVVSRRLKPQDPGRPVDTRVLPVKVALLETSPVFLGQRVEVEIMTGGGE